MIIVVDRFNTIHAVASTAKQIKWADGYATAPNGVSILGSKDDFTIAETSDTAAAIGMLFVDGQVAAPESPEPEPVLSVPVSFPMLTRKELRNGLLSIGVTSADVEAQINAIADPLEREAALIDWQDTKEYDRHNVLIDQIGAAMSLPPEQIDALWMRAAGPK